MSNLSMEQQFALRAFEADAQKMSRDQAIAFLIELNRQFVEQQNAYKKLLAHQWGFETLQPVEE